MASGIDSSNRSPVVDRVNISQMSIGSIVIKYAKLLPKFTESDLIHLRRQLVTVNDLIDVSLLS